jgi:hypothetical protein
VGYFVLVVVPVSGVTASELLVLVTFSWLSCTSGMG